VLEKAIRERAADLPPEVSDKSRRASAFSSKFSWSSEMPIISQSGSGRRKCDVLARHHLGERKFSLAGHVPLHLADVIEVEH